MLQNSELNDLTLSLIAFEICYTSLTENLRRNSTAFTNFWQIKMIS